MNHVPSSSTAEREAVSSSFALQGSVGEFDVWLLAAGPARWFRLPRRCSGLLAIARPLRRLNDPLPAAVRHGQAGNLSLSLQA